MRNIFVFWGALLLVDGVFGVDETVILSVMEGDSVTLKPDTVIPKNDSALWWFGDRVIAKKKAAGIFSISEDVDVRFKDSLELDKLTGSLTITNITAKDTGLYKLQIRGITETFKIFSVTVSGGAMKTVSVKKGETIPLNTGLVQILGYDLILWKFGDQLIAEINKTTNQYLIHDTSDKRFNGRLQWHPQSVSLTISDSRITDTGDYQLNMNSSSHTIQRNISVTVSVSDLSPGAVAGIVVPVLLVFAAVAGLIYYRSKNSKPQGHRDVAEENGTDVSLKDGQQ